jgi:hypothetical protein
VTHCSRVLERAGRGTMRSSRVTGTLDSVENAETIFIFVSLQKQNNTYRKQKST